MFKGLAAIEPSNLHWPDVGMKIITDKNDEFCGRRQIDLSNLLRKGDSLSLRNCTKQKESFKPDMVENPNDPSCVVNMTCMHRDMCSPDQIRFFCRPNAKHTDAVKFNPKNPIGKNCFNKHYKEFAETAGFKNWERCTAHAGRKRCSEFVAEARIDMAEQCRYTGHKTLTAYQVHLSKKRKTV